MLDEVIFLSDAVDSLEEAAESLLDGLEGFFLEMSDIRDGGFQEVVPDGLLEKWDPAVAEGFPQEGGDEA